jgi:N-acetylmuramoyl-L-alanine amidase
MLTLSNPICISNGQWMVPIDFLTTVVPRLTPQVVEYKLGTDRAFVGSVKPGTFSLRLDSVTGGARLTVQFTDKVAVRTASVNGKWVMYLGDQPFEPLESSFHFQNPYISDVQFDDQDGAPKLVITPSGGGLNFYPKVEEGGRILLADVLKPPPPVPQPSRAFEQAPATTAPGPAMTPSPGIPPAPALPVVVLDAGHGGDDAGARSRDGVSEKDLAAQLVARVRVALLATRKYRIVLTRIGDVNATFEQRTVTANVAGGVYFLSFHAGDLGGSSPRIAIYTYQSPDQPSTFPEDETRLIFVPWKDVQQAYLTQSRQLSEDLAQQIGQIAGVTTDAPTAVPVRTLRSVNAPAVAIELGSLTPDENAGALTDTGLQQQIADAVAQVLAGSKAGKSAP